MLELIGAKVKVVMAKNRRKNHEIDQLLTFGSVKF